MKRIVKSLLISITFLSIAGILIWKITDRPNTGPTISVMTYNVGDRAKDPEQLPGAEQLAGLIRRIGVPDILLVQETPWKIKIGDLAELLGFADYVSARSKSFSSRNNSAIFSKYPLSRPHTIPFESNPTRAMAVCAEVFIANKRVLLCSVHLSTLRFEMYRRIKGGEDKIPSVLRIVRNETFRETAHSRSVKKLLPWIESRKADAVIIGGDFNTFFFSKSIRAMSRQFNDALWPSFDYFRGTTSLFPFPIKPRIDFLFYSGNIDSQQALIIRQSLGDHFPIRAQFALP